MSRWTDSNDIKKILLQKWDKGYILAHALCGDDFFPFRIKLNAPVNAEISMCFSEIAAWIDLLKSNGKQCLGYGYNIIEREAHDRISGKNRIPTYVEVPSLQDAVRFIGKQRELKLFLSNADLLLDKWSILRDWVAQNPFKVIRMEGNCGLILLVLNWFSTHNNRDLYLRQLDIPGIDTKFIESNKGILDDLLSVILPQNQIQNTSRSFEARYGLRKEPEVIRFRILDKRLSLNGITDLSVPLAEFQRLTLPFRRVFITENKVNFLCFPPASASCVIFGRGYGVEMLDDIPWLQEKEVFYWGDIDTHGFNILSRARSYLPQIQSFLMTEEILLAHQPLWVTEEKPFAAHISHLTDEEFTLACRLQTNQWGEGVRLEQERIRFSYVQKFIAQQGLTERM